MQRPRKMNEGEKLAEDAHSVRNSRTEALAGVE